MNKEKRNEKRNLSSEAYERAHVKIGHKSGLHMRPASYISKYILSKYSGCEAYVRNGEDPLVGGVEIDGKLYADFNSIMSVLSLGASYGHKVEVLAKGRESKKALEEICAYLSSESDMN